VSNLLDVNFFVACAWKSHADHRGTRRWLESQRRFYTCPLTHLGFLRVSMSPAFRASFADAKAVLHDLTRLKGATFIADALPGTVLAGLEGANEVTDAYLVALARTSRLRLATLDEGLCRKPWAEGVAVNPLRQ